MASCSGIKADGGRCGAQAMRNSQWCIGHDPDKAEARRRRASKGGKRGGRGRPVVELGEIKDRLRAMVEDVRNGKMNRADAAVCGQLYGTLIRCVSVELKAREQQELEARLEALERATERPDQRKGRRWGET